MLENLCRKKLRGKFVGALKFSSLEFLAITCSMKQSKNIALTKSVGSQLVIDFLHNRAVLYGGQKHRAMCDWFWFYLSLVEILVQNF